MVVEITAPKPALDVNRLKNAISSIQPGQTLETMIPEAREYLLSLGEKDVISATVYDYLLVAPADAALPCGRAYSYIVKFVNNAVDHTYDGCAD